MVKVGGKSVPFFAADGKGGNDLKKAMYGMKMNRAAHGTKVEMGGGGKMYEMMSGGLVKQYDEGGEVGDPPRKFFVASGFDNRGDDPSGKQIAAVFMRTEDGVKQINPGDLMEIFPDAENMMQAYRMAGIAVEAGDKGVTFPEMKQGSYTKSLFEEFGAEDMDGLRAKLNLAPVKYDRERDLPKLVPGLRGGM